MIFTDNIAKLIARNLEKSGYFRNKVASVSNYSYNNIEEQMTSLIRFSSEILNKEQMSRKYKKEFFAKNAPNKDIWNYIKLLKDCFQA